MDFGITNFVCRSGDGIPDTQAMESANLFDVLERTRLVQTPFFVENFLCIMFMYDSSPGYLGQVVQKIKTVRVNLWRERRREGRWRII
jgi:hypothetical protein